MDKVQVGGSALIAFGAGIVGEGIEQLVAGNIAVGAVAVASGFVLVGVGVYLIEKGIMAKFAKKFGLKAK